MPRGRDPRDLETRNKFSNGIRFPFTAAGTQSVALSCTSKEGRGQACTAVNSPLLVKGSLSSPVSITPAYAEGPSGHDAPGCVAASKSPTWTLSTIYYDEETEGGVLSAGSRIFSLLLDNPAIGYQASCMPGNAFGDLGPTASSTRLSCAGNEFGSLGADRYRLSTEASFDPLTFRFTVNQTWYCDDVDASKP